jgi:hypothetical protein
MIHLKTDNVVKTRVFNIPSLLFVHLVPLSKLILHLTRRILLLVTEDTGQCNDLKCNQLN